MCLGSARSCVCTVVLRLAPRGVTHVAVPDLMVRRMGVHPSRAALRAR